MGKSDAPQKLFHRAHYNIFAKQMREAFAEHLSPVNSPLNLSARAAILHLALRMAKRFKEDNPAFDPVAFLDKCSPDSERYPFSEFWED